MSLNTLEQKEIMIAQAWSEVRSGKNQYLEAMVIGIETLARGEEKEECLKIDYKGIYGYIPKKLVDDYDFKSLQSYVGSIVEFAVIETFDSENDRLFLGDRLKALEMKEDRFWKYAKKNDEVDAFVRGVDKTGVYLIVEGVRIRMDREDFSYEYHSDLREVVFIGDHIKVKIIEIDRENSSIKVSRKVLEIDPLTYLSDYKVGSVYLGTIINIHIDHGIFIKLEPKGIVARTGFPPAMNTELIKVNERVNFKITGIDNETGRIKGILINPRNVGKRKSSSSRGTIYNGR